MYKIAEFLSNKNIIPKLSFVHILEKDIKELQTLLKSNNGNDENIFNPAHGIF